jgi:hypothetical protein
MVMLSIEPSRAAWVPAAGGCASVPSPQTGAIARAQSVPKGLILAIAARGGIARVNFAGDQHRDAAAETGRAWQPSGV